MILTEGCTWADDGTGGNDTSGNGGSDGGNGGNPANNMLFIGIGSAVSVIVLPDVVMLLRRN